MGADSKPPSSGMSRKAAIAGSAISAVAASGDLGTQIVIAIVGIVAIAAQAVLDYGKLPLKVRAKGDDETPPF
ncbi:MAG: hypothetical protein AAF065_11975 [Verrucomicrobiota bacterium]